MKYEIETSSVRSTQPILIPLIYATVLFLAMSPYACSHPCQFSSTARPGLTRHQQQCVIYKTAQTLRMEQRRAWKMGKRPIANLECRKERMEVTQLLFAL